VLTGQHPHLRASDYGMPPLATTELGCSGQPDPFAHARLVTRTIVAAIRDAALVVVQGDTSSAFGGALGAALAGIPIAHVEAGLRSHDRRNPWPEEDFRIGIDRLAELLLAPTALNGANLRREGVRGAIHVTGNTGIDALVERMPLLRAAPEICASRRLLVTCHRRESWGEGLAGIAACLVALARRGDVAIDMVLHPNPRVAGEMRRLLGCQPDITLLHPCGHLEMLRRMQATDLILSDSGGMQEEAPALGIPLLILRDRTERPEGIASGNAILVGRRPDRILRTVEMLFESDEALQWMRRPSLPYGDGRSSDRIAAIIETWLRRDEPRSPSLPTAKQSAGPSTRFASRM
jgi:UDP-N-acetylglucosamine 2-epimerase (non-hydrolysing)